MIIFRARLCTYHPVLEALAFPLHPLVVLSSIAATWLIGSPEKAAATARLKRLWQALTQLDLPGWLVGKLGGDGDPFFTAARYPESLST